ncbi:hypothetical protein [Corallococcus sp. CA049B]|uniref:hypothetical protein n=1 Tax=Corallococcus sp. CA049B TaxID=2316730 RepID=UPI0018F41184|nr:hypothetical protein [Corallococcus sp. CA049B]
MPDATSHSSPKSSACDAVSGGVGRLRVSEERALGLVSSMCNGAVLTLLRQPEGQRDLGLSDAARETVVAAITSEAAPPANTEVRSAATTLRASLDRLSVLTPGESALLSELLARITDAG